MRHIELPAVGYGDCTVFVGSNAAVLMTDCGSMNIKMRNPDMEMTGVFSILRDRYSYYPTRHFILTHYHRDHLWGAQQILRRQNDYFSKVYLPYLPTDENGRNILVEISAWAYVLASPYSDVSQINTACLTLPLRLWESGAEVAFLKAGDSFDFDGESFQVLNPEAVSSFEAVLYEDLNLLQEKYPQLCEAVEEFAAAYSLIQREPTRSGFERVRKLEEKLRELRAATDSEEIFTEQNFLRALSSAVNDRSVVYHSESILMTADISKERFEELFPKLRPSYKIIKAPHHGTAGAYSTKIAELNPEHLLIHNDEYKPELEVAPEYTEFPAIKHCSGKLACPYLRDYGACCNRLVLCPGAGSLAIKCSDNRKRDRLPKCRIYVVTPAGGRSCFCD